MRGGLVASVLLHAAVLGWALISIQSQRELRAPEPEPIAIDLISASDLTKLRQGVRTAKQLEAEPKESPKPEPAKKEAPRPTPAATAPPPPPPPPEPPTLAKEEPKKEEPRKEEPKEAAAVPPPPALPPPGPTPEEQKQLEDKLREEQRKAEDQKRLEEERKAAEQKRIEAEKKAAEKKKKEDERRKKLAEEKKKREAEEKRKREQERKLAEAKSKFDAEEIAALLNKTPDKGPRPSVPLDQQAKAKGPVLGAPEGRDRQISASELAVLGQIIKSCVQSKWNVQAGGDTASDILVKLRLRFNPDGTLAGEPVVMNQQSSTIFMAFSEGAKRAAQACEPYSLPPEKYEVWKDIVLNFSLRDMVR